MPLGVVNYKINLLHVSIPEVLEDL